MTEYGKLIVFEGPDGVGKSSLIAQCHAQLQQTGVSVEVMSFPGREPGTLGAHIYQLHHQHHSTYGIEQIDPASLQLLHVAAHMDAITQRIRPALQAGTHVILDRYWWSTWVYGAASGVQTTTLDMMVNLERQHWADILPSVVFLLQANMPWRHGESVERFHALRSLYTQLAQQERNRYLVRVIDNSQRTGQALTETLDILHALSEQCPPPSQPAGGTTPSPRSSKPVKKINKNRVPTVLSRLAPAVPSDIFDTYWRFAAERQDIFFRRWEGTPPPWTSDPILATYKFTNAYRAADRVSQYLIRHVIYEGDPAPDEVFFRVMLFKVFNRIDTWLLLKEAIGEITFTAYQFDRYTAIFEKAMADGIAIFSAAYMMPSGGSTFGDRIKHRNYLHLLELMLEDEVPQRLTEMPTMREAFDLLRSYPMLGDFLAYQYITDLNYSTLTNFSEMEFTVPGPGARSGIRKCFTSLGGLSEVDIIRMMTEQQEEHFERLGLTFQSLWGRPLQYIDCQNVFCEVDKYARIAHPAVKGVGDRTRIKQGFRPRGETITYWFPPKWEMNEKITGEKT